MGDMVSVPSTYIGLVNVVGVPDGKPAPCVSPRWVGRRIVNEWKYR